MNIRSLKCIAKCLCNFVHITLSLLGKSFSINACNSINTSFTWVPLCNSDSYFHSFPLHAHCLQNAQTHLARYLRFHIHIIYGQLVPEGNVGKFPFSLPISIR